MLGQISHKHIVILLVIVSFFLHFWNLEYPNSVVFDEVHFGKFASSYFNGSYHFDIHPPLGKMILAAGGALTGFKPGFGFINIGDRYPDQTYVGLRIFPALAGSLIPLVAYLILINLGVSRKVSLLGMLMFTLENAILVQSKFILMDAFMIVFGLSGLLFYLISKNRKTQKGKFLSLLASGLFLGAASSIKWTGMIFGLLVFLFAVVSLANHFRNSNKRLRPALIFGFCIIFVPIVFHMAVYAIHFYLLPHSGGGDAYMSVEFQSTLQGNPNYNPNNQMGFFGKFFELNRVMLSANSGITATHPYSIKWYMMPLMERSVYYWNGPIENGKFARIYLLGNPFVWWPVFMAILGFAALIIVKLVRMDWRWIRKKKFPLILLFAYLMNIATYMFISRVIFLYHYFPSLVIGILLFCLVWEKAIEKGFTKKNIQVIYWVMIGLVIFGFVYFSPLTYGWPLDDNAYKALTWFQSWV